MAEWLSYSLSDFLLFSPRTYWRMMAAGNELLWPLHVATVAIGAMLVIPARQAHGRLRAAPFLLLTLLWCFVGWRFFWQEYAPINWTAPYIAGAFFAQGAALALYGVVAGGSDARTPDADGVAGIGFAVYGLLLHPLTPLAWDRPLSSTDVFGIAPDATAIVTAGILLTQQRHTTIVMLLLIPLGWLAFSGLTHLAFPDPHGWLLLLLAGGIAAAASRHLFARGKPLQGS